MGAVNLLALECNDTTERCNVQRPEHSTGEGKISVGGQCAKARTQYRGGENRLGAISRGKFRLSDW